MSEIAVTFCIGVAVLAERTLRHVPIVGDEVGLSDGYYRVLRRRWDLQTPPPRYGTFRSPICCSLEVERIP